jgi:hypothetical protein
MPFRPHVMYLLEEGLSGCINYHAAMDNLIQRAGMAPARLSEVRQQVEDRYRASSPVHSRAPKRLIVQAYLTALSAGSPEDDRVLSEIITALCKGTFPDATPAAINAIESLKLEQLVERQEALDRRTEIERRKREAEQLSERAAASRASCRAGFRDAFIQLNQLEDPQARGFRLEKFLNEFLEYEELFPRKSFKITGEQIDGSFQWEGRTYLVEAKWVKDRVAGAGFGAFMYKIEGKTADTRGLFISINGYSEEATASLKTKGSLKFVCIDGAHLLRSMEPGRNLAKLFDIVWRHANETGEAYLPVSSKAFISRDI